MPLDIFLNSKGEVDRLIDYRKQVRYNLPDRIVKTTINIKTGQGEDLSTNLKQTRGRTPHRTRVFRPKKDNLHVKYQDRYAGRNKNKVQQIRKEVVDISKPLPLSIFPESHDHSSSVSNEMSSSSTRRTTSSSSSNSSSDSSSHIYEQPNYNPNYNSKSTIFSNSNSDLTQVSSIKRSNFRLDRGIPGSNETSTWSKPSRSYSNSALSEENKHQHNHNFSIIPYKNMHPYKRSIDDILSELQKIEVVEGRKNQSNVEQRKPVPLPPRSKSSVRFKEQNIYDNVKIRTVSSGNSGYGSSLDSDSGDRQVKLPRRKGDFRTVIISTSSDSSTVTSSTSSEEVIKGKAKKCIKNKKMKKCSKNT